MPAEPTAREHHDALLAAGVDPSSAERIGEGWFAVAYRAPDEDGTDLAVRVLKPEAASTGWSDHYAIEVELLRYLEARALRVPREARAIRSDDGTLIATAHRYVAGAPAIDLRLDGTARARLALELGAFLTAMHATPVDEATALGLDSLDLATELYAPLVEEALPFLAPRSRQWLEGRHGRFLAGGGSEGVPRVPLHGDLGQPHVLVRASGALEGVIDFGDALIGDPAFDFAGIGRGYGWRFAEQVLVDYRGDAARDPDLARRAGFYVDVAPLYSTVFGARLGNSRLLARGRRQFAARAAAQTRAGR